MDRKVLYPKWFEGCWWITSVRQKAKWVRQKHPPWLEPFLWKFKVIKEDDRNFLLKVTYPEKPPNLPEQDAHVWVNKETFNFVRGALRIGESEIPMKYDFLASILREYPPGVDLTGRLGKQLFIKGRLDRDDSGILLKTYTTKTSKGDIVVSSPELPYHLRIKSENYIIELEAWYSRE